MATRFWTWHANGYVRLSLTEGQTLRTSYGGPDDEGYSWRGESWTLQDGVVRNEITDRGRDCDGGYSHYADYVCPVADLAGWVNPDGVAMPSWDKASASQWDQYAELDGY